MMSLDKLTDEQRAKLTMLNGKPFSECTDEEIAREHNEGLIYESQVEVLSAFQKLRLHELEKEMDSRPDFGSKWTGD